MCSENISGRIVIVQETYWNCSHAVWRLYFKCFI